MAEGKTTEEKIEIFDTDTCTVTRERAAREIYNVGNRKRFTRRNGSRPLLSMSWNGDIVSVPEELLPGHLLDEMNWNQDFIVDSSKIRRDLGYTELISRNEALRKTIAWETDHPPDSPGAAHFGYSEEDAILADMA